MESTRLVSFHSTVRGSHATLTLGALILLVSDAFCHLIFFENRLEPDQDRQNRSWFGSKPFDTLKGFLTEVFEKVNFERSRQATTKA